MNKVELSYLGGMPFTQADLAWMQSAYTDAFAAIAKLAGSMTIISGMAEDGDDVANGWIALNGELLPFIGGDKSIDNFTIQQTTVNRTFNDGTGKNIRFNRVATFSVTGEYAYSDLIRLNTLKQMNWCIGDQKPIHCDAAYLTANFDATGKGIAGTEREGWAICNGNNGTEDLQGYFLVGYDKRTSDPSNGIWDAAYNTPGNTGGEKKHQLTVTELPSFTPTGDIAPNDSTPGANLYTRGGDSGNDWFGKNIGGNQAHENRPPFKVKVFIEKIAA